jgi:carboxyl-terminal processing protease
MNSRSFLSVLFSLALLASSLAPAAHAQETTGLDGVRAAYYDLLDLFYRPLNPRDLLQAGWAALRADAERRGVAPPGPLPELPADADTAFDAFAGAYSSYVANLSSSLTASTAAADVQSGMADSVHEQHTHYLPPSVMQRFLSIVGGGQQSVGLGIKVGGDPPGLITEVAPGGPAAVAGLQAGDVVVGADGKDLSTADSPSIAAALTGAAGSTITLTVDRGSGPMSIVATRGPYYFPPLESRVLADGVGYLRLADFVISGTTLPNGTELLSDLDRRLDELDAQGAQALVLDLRNNGGGSVQTADALLGRFLPDTSRSVREFDHRGHETFELASGRLHPRQLPMAVLINGGSASASEVTAVALHDAHRAVLVGQRTAGAVASSELLPLPGGGGLQIAVAAATGAESGADLDGVGVTPDVVIGQTRTLADYRSGHDPQLESAIAALANAPPPPVAAVQIPALSSGELDRLLESVLPTNGEVSTNDRLLVSNRWQRLDFIHPNELIDQNGGAPDPIALQQTIRGRGYEGSVLATYGSSPGDLPSVTVNADLYATNEGAHSAASTNDLTQVLQVIDSPVQTGDETVAYRGAWIATGSTQITWRRGRLVVTVTYSDVPGFERLDTLAAITQMVDARAQQLTLP